MADGAQASFVAPLHTIDGGAIVFAIAGGRYALPLASVEAIMAPPVLCRVPHAPEALLGAGNLGGQVLPVVDLAAFFPGRRGRRYDGGGEMLRVSAAGGAVGFWVDRVEQFAPSGVAVGDAVTVIDPDPLVRLGMTAPNLGADATHPLGDAGELVIRTASRDFASTYFLVEAAGERCQLARDTVLEFVEAPPSTPVPGAPAEFLGIGIVRGEPLPMLSLAVLLGLPVPGQPSSFALVRLDDGGRFLLGLDRIVGLRAQQRRTGRRWVDQTADIIAGSGEAGRELDLAGTLSDELHAIVAALAPAAAVVAREEAASSGAPYLVFLVADETYALPVDAVERVVPTQKPIALPRRSGSCAVAHAIELRGQLIPVRRLEGAGEMAEPGAYVVMRGAMGMTAIAVQRVDRLITLRPDQITPAPGEQSIFGGVAVLDEADDLLRILAADRLMQAS